MSISVKILGSNSASFAHNRHQTSQVVEIDNIFFLVDCGEGTQIQAKRYNVKISKIDYILISHLHGDHYYGLIGLISTMHLYGRRKTLTLIGPPGLLEIITLQLKHSGTNLAFKINLIEWKVGIQELILDLPKLTIKTIPMNHSISCSGYLFEEKENLRRLNVNCLPEQLTPFEIKTLKSGADLLNADGSVRYVNQLVTLPPKKHDSYAFCSDTRHQPEILNWIKGVDLLYHETTFMNDLVQRAQKTYHSTTTQAGQLAAAAEVKKLIIGHFSTRYRDLTPLLDEVKACFDKTYLATEGSIFKTDD